MKSSTPLSRRSVLRGAGVCIGLPLLEAMIPRRAAAATPVRFVGWFHPNGVNEDFWKPATEGPLGALPPTLAPLANVKEHLLVLSGLRIGPPTFSGSHAGGQRAFLTASSSATADTLDQVIAAKVGGGTRIPSLQLSIEVAGAYEPYTDNDKDGYADSPANNFNDTRDYCGGEDCRISVKGGTRLPVMNNPRLVFEKIFGAGTAPDGMTGVDLTAVKRRNALRKSVLDYALDQTKRLQGKLGASDKLRLDEYTTGIRDLETAIGKSEQPVSVSQGCSPAGKPKGIAIDPLDRLKTMALAMTKAFECDATRSITIMSGAGQSSMKFVVDGKSYFHHDSSHWLGDTGKRKAKDHIDHRLIEGYAAFLEMMKGVKEGSGTMLDNVGVYLSSDIADPNKHDQARMPVLMGGRLGGAFKTGRHIEAGIVGRQTGDLFLAILQAFGIQQAKFGDFGTKALTEVMG